MKSLLLFFTLAFSFRAFSDEEPTKTEIILKMAEQIFVEYKSGLNQSPIKPRIALGKTIFNTQGISEVDIQAIMDQLESKLVTVAEVVDRTHSMAIANETEIQQSGTVKSEDMVALGNRSGASQLVFLAFSDSISSTEANEERVDLRAKLTAIDIETQRKTLVKVVSMSFKHRKIFISYPVRDAAIGTLNFNMWGGFIGAVGFLAKSYSDKSKYDKATSPNDAKSYREKTKQDQSIASASLGVGIISGLLNWQLNSLHRDYEGRDVYETFAEIKNPDGGLAISLGLTWKK